jgi:hypothetical protein
VLMWVKQKEKGEVTCREVTSPMVRGQSKLRTGCAEAFVDLYIAQIRELCSLVAEEGSLDPVNVVAEIKVNARSGTDRRKGTAGAHSIAVEGVNDVIATIQNAGAVNLELHLCVRARVIAVTETNVDHRLRGRTVSRDALDRGDVIANCRGARYPVFQLGGKVVKAYYALAVFIRCGGCAG